MTFNFDVIDLFPSPVAAIKLDYDFQELKKFENHSLCNCNNSKKYNEINDDVKINEVHFYILDEFPTIKNYLTNVIRDLLNTTYGYKNKFIINTSWLTKMFPDMEGRTHYHNGHSFSGVLYFDNYDDISGSLKFYSPLSRISRIDLEGDDYSTWKEFEVDPKKNLLLIFPSYLEHQIGMNYSTKNRYSLAFNILSTSFNNGDSEINIEKIAKQIQQG